MENSMILRDVGQSRSTEEATAGRVTTSACALEEGMKDENSNSNVDAEYQDMEMTFPDGGWKAWSVVFGAACTTCVSWGYIITWGAFQVYYENVKFPEQSPSSIAWIGSIQYSLVFLPGMIIGRTYDMGYFRPVFIVANGVLILATFLVAECRLFWQVVLLQGILTGMACGTMWSPLLAVVSHWLVVRRQLAFGLLAVGSAIGGTVFPIMVRALLPTVGFQWTMPILAFVLLGFSAVSNALVHRRRPPRIANARLLSFAHFRNPAFTIYAASSMIAFLGLYTIFTYIASYATQKGISQSTAYNLVSIANTSSLIGRLLAAVLADRFGPLNVMMPLTLFAGIITFAWPFTHSLQAIISITVLYGISSGAFLALLGSPVVQMGESSSVGERTGLLLSVTAIGALAGPPISGAIRSGAGDWKSVGYYAGSTIILAVLLMWTTRILLLKHPFKGIA